MRTASSITDQDKADIICLFHEIGSCSSENIDYVKVRTYRRLSQIKTKSSLAQKIIAELQMAVEEWSQDPSHLYSLECAANSFLSL